MSAHDPQYYRDKADYLEQKADLPDPIDALVNSGSPDFGPDCILVGRTTVNGEVYPTLSDRWGNLFTNKNIDDLLKIVSPFFEDHDDDQIEEFNFQLYRHRREQERQAEQRLKEQSTHKPKRKPKPGYVYLLKGQDTYKIGRAKNPQNRSETLAVQLPFTVDLLHTIEADDYEVAERELHGMFASARTNGEWFALTPDEVDEIQALRRFQDGVFQ